MKFETIENLIVWQKARTLTVETFAALKKAQDDVVKELLQKAPITIMNIIAEAYEKPSKKELIDTLYTAKGACGPYRSLLHLAVEMWHVDSSTHHSLINTSLDVTKLLAGFIKKLKEVKAATAEASA